MRRALKATVTTLSIVCAIVTIGIIIFADAILKDNNVYTLITTTTESINISFETDPLVLDGTNLSLMQGVTATSESGDDVTALVDAMVVNEINKKVVVYSVNDSRYNLETFKRGLELKNYKGPSITIKDLGENSNYTCDINEIEDYIFTLMDAGYITADDGYENDISPNVYISPDVNITEAGKQKIKLIVKNSFADFAEKEITIKITGELARDEIIVATETVTVKRDNTYSSNRESSTAVNVEESTFSTSVNSQPIGNQATESVTQATAPISSGILRPHIPMYPVRPLIPIEPILPIVPIVPTEPTAPTAPTEEVPTEEIPTGEAPTEEIPTEEIPTGEAPTEEIPTEEIPTEEIPTGEVPTEEIPTEEIPTEEVPTEEIPTEEAPTEEIPTELPPELATAVIHFADDNKREPITVNVGDTFTYDVYLKLNAPEVQSFALCTYFNQPVGTKQTANQAGSVTVNEENQVLKIADDGYTPYYSPFREDYDLMKSDSYLIGFATGALNENNEYLMIETENGEFTQQGGCLVSTITFTVQRPGEVEVFTRVDSAVIDYSTAQNAEYVAVYNSVKYSGDTSLENEESNPETTSADLTQMKKELLSSNPMRENDYIKKGYDVNKDGKYTLADIILISKDVLKAEEKAS